MHSDNEAQPILLGGMRNRGIAARLAGVPAAELAAIHAITERQIGRIMADHRQHQALSESAPAAWEAAVPSLGQELESLDRTDEAAQGSRANRPRVAQPSGSASPLRNRSSQVRILSGYSWD